MKKNEIKELKNKSAGELEAMRALRFDLAAGKVKNVNELHQNRKKIARAKTFLHQQANAQK
jgi:ribosomal protein L29